MFLHSLLQQDILFGMMQQGRIEMEVDGQKTYFQVHTPELLDDQGNLVAGEVSFHWMIGKAMIVA